MLSSSLRRVHSVATLVALLTASFATAQTPPKLDPPAKPTVTGKFVGNGKSAAIQFVTVREREPFNDKEAIALIFSEKDPAGSKDPAFDVMLGRLGSALSLSVFYDGGIFGCEVSHAAHAKRGFSSIGQIKLAEFKIAGGNVTGRLTTGKELDTFGEKWEVDLTFSAPLPEKLRNPSTATAAKPAAGSTAQPAKPEPKAPAGPLVPINKVPLPKDATGVDYKTTVKQIHFASPRQVETVAKEFSANLKQQGWKDGAGSLMAKQNAILKREQGDAKLTIMIQPAASGSVVKIFTEGLDWTGAPESKPAATGKANPPPSNEDINAQVQKALEDALKSIPKGL
jgi:hypothetical protein